LRKVTMAITALSVPALLFLFACGRTEPDSSVAPPLLPDTTLVLIAEYVTSVPEPSGLAYHSGNNTLWTVSDGNSTVYEMDFRGNVLRSFVIQNIDLEGIALTSRGDTMLIADEVNKQIATYRTTGMKLSTFGVNVATVSNNALEGVAVGRNNRIFVLNEKLPRMLLEFAGGVEVARTEITAAADLSDVCYDSVGDCLWIISDESQKVLKCTTAGAVLAEYGIAFTKGEGIAVVGNRIYIVNDANGKLYVYNKPQ